MGNFQKSWKTLIHRFKKPNKSEAGKTKLNLNLGTKKKQVRKDRLASVSKIRLTAHFSTVIMKARGDRKIH